MQVIVYQMRKNGVEVARDLLGDEARHIGDLRLGVLDEGDRRRLTKGAQLQRNNGEVIMELLDVQIEAIKSSRMVLNHFGELLGTRPVLRRGFRSRRQDEEQLVARSAPLVGLDQGWSRN